MVNLKDGIKMQVVIGKFITYTELIADNGYCFYDKDANETDLQYHTNLKTPETDVLVLAEKYVAVLGDAEKLNQELADKLQDENAENIEG